MHMPFNQKERTSKKEKKKKEERREGELSLVLGVLHRDVGCCLFGGDVE